MSRYFQVTNPDGSQTIATITGHQTDQQTVPDGAVEIGEQQAMQALTRVQQQQDLAEHAAHVAQTRADTDLAGWRQVAAERLAASGMPAAAVAAVTGVPAADQTPPSSAEPAESAEHGQVSGG